MSQDLKKKIKKYSIPRVAKSYLPIFIPWQREQRHIISGFDSTALEDSQGPWKDASPFEGHAVFSSLCQVRLEVGTARDIEGHSASNSITSEHFSGSLGISVGNAVARVGVTANYDQQMQETANTSRASHNSRFRCGRIALAKDPPISAAAKALLERKDGPELFADLYGDYFVAGYVLGADAGGCLAASSSAKREVETVTTTVNVEVLWEDYTDSTSKTDTRETSSLGLTFYGYDTLDETNLLLRAEPGKSTEHIRAAALLCMTKTNTLQQRLNERIHGLGLRDGSHASIRQCSSAVEAGVVVELSLVPFRIMKEYFECVTEGMRKRALEAVTTAE